MSTKEGSAEGQINPVTVADTESNKVILNGLRTLFAGKGETLHIVSEETEPSKKTVVPSLGVVNVDGGDAPLDRSVTSIIVDPLDATLEFTQEVDTDGSNMLPFVTVLICVVQNGVPVAGVINRPFVKDEAPMWGSAFGETPTLTGVAKTTPDEAASALVTVSRSHAGKGGDVVSDNLAPKKPKPAGGAGYKSWLVLTGQVDAYIHVTKIKIWDTCAGHALIRAAGGDITDKAGKSLVYERDNPVFTNGLVAALDKSKIKDFYVEKLKDVELKSSHH